MSSDPASRAGAVLEIDLGGIVANWRLLAQKAAPAALKRQVGAWGSPPPTIELMRRLRDAFDPQRTLSPGRYVV